MIFKRDLAVNGSNPVTSYLQSNHLHSSLAPSYLLKTELSFLRVKERERERAQDLLSEAGSRAGLRRPDPSGPVKPPLGMQGWERQTSEVTKALGLCIYFRPAESHSHFGDTDREMAKER